MNRNYTSTIETDASLKVIVLYKLESQTLAEGILSLDSSIEKAGMTLTEDTQVTHSTWAVKNNVVTEPTHGLEFMVTNLDTSPIKVLETFEKRVMTFPPNAKWVTAFPDYSAMWARESENTVSIERGDYTVYDEYVLANSAEGLRVCYGKFFNGQAKPVANMTKRIGAACSLVGSTTVQLEGADATSSLNCWQLVQSSLVIPFGCPRTWKAKKVRLDWSNWTGTATTGSKIYVWLARD